MKYNILSQAVFIFEFFEVIFVIKKERGIAHKTAIVKRLDDQKFISYKLSDLKYFRRTPCLSNARFFLKESREYFASEKKKENPNQLNIIDEITGEQK